MRSAGLDKLAKKLLPIPTQQATRHMLLPSTLSASQLYQNGAVRD